MKPENLLMTSLGVVKLSDFGVAKILTDVEDCRSTSGTHGYMVSTHRTVCAVHCVAELVRISL